MAGQGFAPGQKVTASGIYRVSHDQHRHDHEVTLFSGEKFPACLQCGRRVRFQLQRAAGPIEEDSDFKGKKKAWRKSASRH